MTATQKNRLTVALSALVVGAFFLLGGCMDEGAPTCPKGARHAVTSTGVEACIFEHVRLPDARGLRIYCDKVQMGHVDFVWEHNPWTVGYSCPEGWQRSNGQGRSSCRSPASQTTQDAPRERLACGLLNDGAIAMAWKAPAAFSNMSRVAVEIIRGVSPFVPNVP